LKWKKKIAIFCRLGKRCGSFVHHIVFAHHLFENFLLAALMPVDIARIWRASWVVGTNVAHPNVRNVRMEKKNICFWNGKKKIAVISADFFFPFKNNYFFFPFWSDPKIIKIKTNVLVPDMTTIDACHHLRNRTTVFCEKFGKICSPEKWSKGRKQ